jgi:hypothetical protein
MKKTIGFLVLTGLALLLTGAASVTLTVLKPSPVSLPKNIKKVGLLDRTVRPDKKVAQLESVLNAKTPDTDVEGARLCLDGAGKVLLDSGLYEVKKVPGRLIGADIIGSFPTALSWEQVQKICETNGVDALISLEIFNSDFVVSQGQRAKTGGLIPFEFYASGSTTVKAGFRVYNPADKVIVDEYRLSKTKQWESTASTIQGALNLMVNKTKAVGETGAVLGSDYGYRIIPSWYYVTRPLYDTPKKYKEMVRGTRLSQVADWNGAIKAWEAMIPKCKKDDHAGRAAYNIAVSYEVLGDLQKAREWAVKSFTEFGLKKAKEYVDTLDERIYQEKRAKDQAGMTNS